MQWLPRNAPAPRFFALMACVLALLLLSACGGSSNSSSVATLAPGGSSASPRPSASSSAQSGDVQKQALAYSQCMREHGIANFPDPVIEGGGMSLTLDPNSLGFDPTSPTFKAALEACQTLFPLPQGGQATLDPAGYEKALKFAQCMRANGVANFPDPVQPNSSGPVFQTGGPGDANALGPDSPVMQSAMKACASLLPGGPGTGTNIGGQP